MLVFSRTVEIEASRENDGNGLYYYRARYYHPGLQRFISEDPIGFAGGDVNLYSYVFNRPLDIADPLGLCPLCALAIPPVATATVQAAIAVGGFVAGAVIGATLGDILFAKRAGKGDDPGFRDEGERQRAIEEAQRTLADPNASAKEKQQAKRRIQELSRRKAKRAHGADTNSQLIMVDPSLLVPQEAFAVPPVIEIPGRLGCRKGC